MVYENSDVAALDNFSLTINEGEFAFLVGPSGSGKTTIIKLLTGEIRPSDGKVIVNGFNMGEIKRRKMPKMRRTLGVIFQDFRLIENMTVYDNVAFAMRVVGASNREIKARVPHVWSSSVLTAVKSACLPSFPAASSSVLPLQGRLSTILP